MPGRMEGNIDSIAGQRFPVADRLYRHVAKALLEERRSLLMANVDLGAEAGVIAMRMGYQRPPDRPPRINVKLADGAIKPPVA